MTISLSGPTTIRTFGFNIPCRRFLIRANVTRDKRLPVVDEFVLRALKVCEELPVRRIASFFGFTPSEMEKVISDLIGSGLVVVHGDSVRLHASAHEHFRGASDGVPHIVEVESWPIRVWFDLVSKNMAPPGTRSARNLIDVHPASLARDLPVSYARTAFEDNFADYLRRVRRIPNPDRFALYSVPEAMAERFGSLVFPVDQNLVFDPDPRLEPNLLAIHADDMPRLRKLADAVLDTYRGLIYADTSRAALAEFASLSGDPSVTDAYGGTATFDLPRWISLNPDIEANDRRPILGASYLRRNIDVLTALIDNLPKPATSVEVAPTKEIVWYRPGGTAWGCSPELRDAIRSIRAAIRRKFGRTSIRSTLVSPDGSRGRESPRRFEGLFDTGYLAPPGFLSPAVEAIHVPDVATLLLVNVDLSSTVQIPVGFASTRQQERDRIVSKLSALHSRLSELWRTERRDDEEPTELEPEDDDQDE
ncbi:hypothetical protein JQ617_24235 [Bradyrhizobium sp. KB893862 SZCCT0404]|uniref:hypothetical protein n=1 Tax=Bradyrhizobium sp. KB893862 SZCCT0404 TaxID=2807672 RepID=UPI001BA94EE3|nr:hypothetical protein [Bradyrhizobium sp. KB893862 SZCCT0404]MBR1177083.1 hypothetical protein [Bradyrhizobium sp. KB893862 SZCCT0404]